MEELSRNAIRCTLRERRRTLKPRERQRLSLALCRRFATTHLFHRSQHIAFYLPNDGEVDLTPLMERALAMGKRCYLPVLSPLFHNRLWFAPFHRQSELLPNRFRIPEPVAKWSDMRRVWTLDLVLTPLVAFDGKGNRLGMGGGFYDRTLAYLHHRKYWRKPSLLGVAYEFQKLVGLPQEPWDVPLDGVVTDQFCYGMSEGEASNQRL